MGIQAGDRILQINQQPFNWFNLVELVQAGKPIELKIEQRGQIKDLVVQPEKKRRTLYYRGNTKL